jgi:glyoxalase superfamily protein
MTGMLSDMTHYSRLSKIVIDAPRETHDREVVFWQAALGVALQHFEKFPDFHGADLTADGHIGLLLQHLGDGPPKLHLDIHTNDRAAEVGRLERLGASVIDDGEHWTIMRDPAGLVFCVVPDRSVNETNASAWDLSEPGRLVAGNAP